MERTSFENWNCSVARTLEVIGDWWTMMIVREAFYGTRTFSGFQSHLGISRNILSRRLTKMEGDGLLKRSPSRDDKRSQEYRLTEKGRDLFAILVSMTQWGDTWENRGSGPPVVLKCRDDGSEIRKIAVMDSKSKILDPGSVYVAAGPGADQGTKNRFAEKS